MEIVNGPIPLGEWLPDLQSLKFPNLEEARYVEPVGTVYKYFEPLVDTGGPVVPGDFIRGSGQAVVSGVVYTYAGTDDGIFMSSAGAAFSARTATMGPTQYDFLQFDEFEIVATAAEVLYHTAGSATNFATLGSGSGTAPAAQRIGKINKFVLVGNTSVSPHHMRWSGLDNPTSWPTPNSSTAIAQQAGEQYLDSQFGEITGFSNGDQFGLVFQKSAITRVTYVGPPVVFQFDKISEQVGCAYPRSIVQVGSITYFIAADGFYRTDGVSVENIGLNKVNKYFVNNLSDRDKWRVHAAHNRYRNLIYWAYPNTPASNSTPSDIILYNHLENRFTHAPQVCEGILGTNGLETSSALNITGFGSLNTFGAFQASTTGGTAFFITGFAEFNPGNFSHLSGVKLLVDQTSNAIFSITTTSNDLVNTDSSGTITTNSATGFMDFRRNARYHQFEISVLGVFNEATSLELKAKGSGGR